jgi:3-dehydroquinate synthetase
MKTLNLDLGEKSYPIYIGQNLLNQKALLSKHILGKQVMIQNQSYPLQHHHPRQLKCKNDQNAPLITL